MKFDSGMEMTMALRYEPHRLNLNDGYDILRLKKEKVIKQLFNGEFEIVGYDLTNVELDDIDKWLKVGIRVGTEVVGLFYCKGPAGWYPDTYIEDVRLFQYELMNHPKLRLLFVVE
jgi:hypothetical protein